MYIRTYMQDKNVCTEYSTCVVFLDFCFFFFFNLRFVENFLLFIYSIGMVVLAFIPLHMNELKYLGLGYVYELFFSSVSYMIWIWIWEYKVYDMRFEIIQTFYFY